jgi:hypothetical protein
LLRPLPMLRPRIGRAEIRKVDKLSTIRVASARYSVPHRLVGAQVEAVTYDGVVRIYRTDTGELVAVHDQLAPGESSILDEHYPTPRKPPSRGPRARTDTERAFLALGEPPTRSSARRRGRDDDAAQRDREIVDELLPAHGERRRRPSVGAGRPVLPVPGRRHPRSILAIGPAAPEPADAGDRVVIDLPAVEQRGSFDAYRIEGLA